MNNYHINIFYSEDDEGELIKTDNEAEYGECVFTTLCIDRGGIHIHD
jgi:hypothetical protein